MIIIAGYSLGRPRAMWTVEFEKGRNLLDLSGLRIDLQDYEDTCQLCCVHGPEGLIVEFAQQIASDGASHQLPI